METSSEYQYDNYDPQYQETENRYDSYQHDVSTSEYEQNNRYNRDEEEEEEEQEEESQSGGMGKIVAIVILTVLLGGSLGANYYLFDNNETLVQTQEAEKARLDTLMAAASAKAEVEKQLAETKALADSYQAQSENARNMLDEANAEIEKLERRLKKMSNANAGAGAYKTQLTEAQALNANLQAQIKALADELTLVKAENTALKDSINTLAEDRKRLADKIREASNLQAHTIKVESLSRRKKDKFEFTDKASRTNRIAISFELSENKLAAVGKRNLHVLIIAPGGDVLSSGDARFTIQPDGKESSFTRVKEVDYPPTGGKIFFNWDDTKEYAKGEYTIEIYCDGMLIGQSQLTLK